MNKQTLVKGMFLLAKTFKDFKAHEDKSTIDIWFDVFQGEDDILFESAIKICIVTFEYSNPKISNINRILTDIKNPNKQLPGDIYDEIMMLIRNKGSRGSAKSLTEISQKVAKGMGGIQTIALSTNQDYDRSQILKMAEQYLSRETDDLLLTNSMKKEQLENQKRLLQLTEGIGN